MKTLWGMTVLGLVALALPGFGCAKAGDAEASQATVAAVTVGAPSPAAAEVPPPAGAPLAAAPGVAPAAGTPAESGDPCADLKARVCAGAGEASEICGIYEVVIQTLPPVACSAALTQVDGILAKAKALRKPCDDLVAKLCADLGPEIATCAQVKEQTPQIPVPQCQMMLTEAYPEVLAELKAMEARNQPLTAEQQARIAASDAASFGPDDARVTIVSFSDFQCPYCSQAAKVTEGLRERYSDKVRLVFRHFPLPFHGNAHLAAQAALAAKAQGKFWPLHDLMFAHADKLDREGLLGLAKEAGLDVAALARALDEGTYKAAVDADLELGKLINVEGTPTFYLNGKAVPNPTDLDAVARLIDAVLASN